MLELAVASAVIWTDSPSELTQVMTHPPPTSSSAMVECRISQAGRVAISVQQTALASAVLTTAGAKSAGGSVYRRPHLLLSFTRQWQTSGSDEHATASIASVDNSVKADYVKDPRELQSAATLHSMSRPGELLAGAEAVHFNVSVGAKQSAVLGMKMLCFTGQTFLAGLTSTRLYEITQTDRRVPALQTIWQKLNLRAPKTSKARHWLVISQQGACLQDYFDM